MCFCAVNCNLNCYLSVDLLDLPVIRRDVDSERGGGGGGGEIMVWSCFCFCFCRLVSVSTYVLLYHFSDLEWCLILDCAIAQLFGEFVCFWLCHLCYQSQIVLFDLLLVF